MSHNNYFMKVVKLFIKDKPGARVQEVQTLNLQRGYEISGDVNALPGNPRQVLIASTSTLTEFGLKPGELKENLLVDTPIEQLSSGTVLQVGSLALIRLTFPCEPCSYLNELQPGLAKRIKGKRGFLGMIIRDGQVLAGDEITLAPYQFKPLPDEAKGRFAEFVQRIPSGKVVKTTDLLMAMGVSKAYARAIPTFLKKANSQLPIHRIVRADGRLLFEYVIEQERVLLAEGVKIEQNQIADFNAYWDSSQFHELGNF
ncbi:MOSC domain-containing protein [Floridanema flaviceps]